MAETTFTTFYESKSITATTADAAATLVYTVPAHHDAQVTMLMAANGGATITINIQVYQGDSAVYSYLLRSHSILTGLSYNILGASDLFLHPGDRVVAFKSGGTLDVSISGKHIYNPARKT